MNDASKISHEMVAAPCQFQTAPTERGASSTRYITVFFTSPPPPPSGILPFKYHAQSV